MVDTIVRSEAATAVPQVETTQVPVYAFVPVEVTPNMLRDLDVLSEWFGRHGSPSTPAQLIGEAITALFIGISSVGGEFARATDGRWVKNDADEYDS